MPRGWRSTTPFIETKRAVMFIDLSAFVREHHANAFICVASHSDTANGTALHGDVVGRDTYMRQAQRLSFLEATRRLLHAREGIESTARSSAGRRAST